MEELALARNLKDEIKMNRGFASLELEALLNIAYASEQFQQSGNTLFSEHGLTRPLYNALRILRGGPKEGIRSLDILERMVFGTPDITRLIDNLEKNGYAKRERYSQDRRVVYVLITEKGRKLLSKLDRSTSELAKQLLGHMSQSKLKQISKLMVEVRARSD